MKKSICAIGFLAVMLILIGDAFASIKNYNPDEKSRDYSAAGWYTVCCIVPEGYDYVYIYDMPSSTKGDSMCRADDGDMVYVYYTTSGVGKKDSVWGYCSYYSERKGRTYEGFIRFCNIVEYDVFFNCCPEPPLSEIAEPAATPEPVQIPLAQEIPELETLTVYNCRHWVSLRKSPDVESARLAEVPRGTQVLGYWYNKYWYACYYDGLFGYIGSSFLY